jgi:hypothetical protein
MVLSKITQSGLKSHFQRQNILSLLLGIAQSSTNFMLAQQLFDVIVYKPAMALTSILKTYLNVTKPSATFSFGKDVNGNPYTWDLVAVLEQIMVFVVCSTIIFVMSVVLKSSMKNITYTYDVSANGWWKAVPSSTTYPSWSGLGPLPSKN